MTGGEGSEHACKKILNNNVITSNNEKGQEIIIMGKGIGWKLKPGDLIDEGKIEKTFSMDTATSTAKLKQLFLEVRIGSVQAGTQIVDYAVKNLGKELKKNVYIMLTDHIDFAIERFRKGITFKTALYWEIRKVYPKEFAVGRHALDIIEQCCRVRLPEEEAASIALHLVNAEYDGNMNRTENMISIVNGAPGIVRCVLKVDLDQNSPDYQRFVTHLLFFAQRVLDKKPLEQQGDFLYEAVKTGHPREFQCAGKIAEYVNSRYGVAASGQELTFLTVHIVRVTPGQGGGYNLLSMCRTYFRSGPAVLSAG